MPHALCVVYATLVWSTREAEVALLFAGQVSCEAANFALKRLIKQDRPWIHGKGYGMPSSHAQFVAFWAVALVLFLLVRHRPRTTATTTPAERAGGGSSGGGSKNTAGGGGARHYWSFAERAAFSLLTVVLAALVAWSRVYLNYHTVHQVLVGCLAGGACAVAWFAATGLARHLGLLAWAVDLPPARWLRIRDLVVEEDLAHAGWERWERRRRQLETKKDG